MPILVVEDSDDDFQILEVCLRGSGVHNRLIRCRTGSEIARYLSDANQVSLKERPVIIFLDLNLPGADGRSVLQQFRQNPVFGLIPVVVLTTSSQSRDIEVCYRNGASGYLVKPLDLEAFERKIKLICDYWLHCVRLPISESSLLAS